MEESRSNSGIRKILIGQLPLKNDLRTQVKTQMRNI
jgi:hypothetical protein